MLPCAGHQRPLVSRIRPGMADSAQASHGYQQEPGGYPTVMRIGRRDGNGEGQSISVYQEVALAAHHPFSPIPSSRAVRLRRLHGLTVEDGCAREGLLSGPQSDGAAGWSTDLS